MLDDGIFLSETAILNTKHLSAIVLLQRNLLVAACGKHRVYHKRHTSCVHPKHRLVIGIDFPASDDRSFGISYLFEKLTVLKIVFAIGQLIAGLGKSGVKHILQYLELGIHAFACSAKNQVAYGIEVVQILAEALQSAEPGMHDALQITQSTFQSALWVCLQSIDNVQMRGRSSNGDNLHNTLAVRVAEVVNSHECILLLDELLG